MHPSYKDNNKIFVFANTGKENEKTLEFVDRCDKEFNLNLVWIEADIPKQKGTGTKYKIVNFKTASRNGEPFEDVIRKFGLPSKVYRHCTRDLKEIPMHKYAKDMFGHKNYLTAIGIRADEKHRLGTKPNVIYPLADLNFDEIFVRDWWAKKDFDLELKDYQGNCDLCFLKSTRKKLTLISENPESAIWWQDMEDKYSDNDFRTMFDVYRGDSIDDLIERAKRPFRKAIDKKELRDSQMRIDDPNMDIEFDCFCKMN